MDSMALPILIIVASNTVYNICAKSTPEGINSFASLAITYVVAAACAAAMYFLTSGSRDLVGEWAKANWASFALGAAVVGLEFGFIAAFRAGWKVGTAQLVASALLTIVLLVVGAVIYHEAISARQLLGVVVCGVGLALISL